VVTKATDKYIEKKEEPVKAATFDEALAELQEVQA